MQLLNIKFHMVKVKCSSHRFDKCKKYNQSCTDFINTSVKTPIKLFIWELLNLHLHTMVEDIFCHHERPTKQWSPIWEGQGFDHLFKLFHSVVHIIPAFSISISLLKVHTGIMLSLLHVLFIHLSRQFFFTCLFIHHSMQAFFTYLFIYLSIY
jgi:hypothetical protein